MKRLDKTKYYDISNLNEKQIITFIELLKIDGNINEDIIYIIKRVNFPINRKYLKAHVVYWDRTRWNIGFNNYTDALTLF